MSGTRWIRIVLWNIRFALRGLRHRPGFSAAVILTVALGIGANAAIFSTVDRLLFRPPPMLRAPALVHRIYVGYTNPEGTGVGYNSGIPYVTYRAITRDTRAFARTAMDAGPVNLMVGVGIDAREMPVSAVSASFFGFFDAPPVLGRYFTAEEDLPPAGTPVAVLSYGMWQKRYAGRSDVLGAALEIGPTLYTVIGVAPRGFVGFSPEEPPVAFVPASSYAAGLHIFGPGKPWWTRQGAFAGMLAQRKSGVTIAAAEADLTYLLRRGWDTHTSLAPPRAVVGSVLRERGPQKRSLAKVAALVAAVAVIVLVIAGANVANLLLARVLSRRTEIAVRTALGASRGRLLSEVFSESALLAGLGGVAGLVIAQVGGSVLRSALVPSGVQAPVLGDARTLVTMGVSVLAVGVLTALLPAWEASRVDPVRDLKAGRSGETRGVAWVRTALLITQAAFSVLLLAGAGLFVRSLNNVKHVPLGYEPSRVLSVRLEMRGVPLDSVQRFTLEERLLAAAQHIPDVEHATLNTGLPFQIIFTGGFEVPGMDSAARIKAHEFYWDAVSPDYFATMSTRIVEGRGIQAGDVTDAPAAMVVSRALAKLVWPGTDPIGHCVSLGQSPGTCTYVVGVAEDIKYTHLSDDPGFYYYLSAAQIHSKFFVEQMGLLVRAHGEPVRDGEVVRRALQRAMPGNSYVTITPLADMIGEQMHSWQLGATMFVVFGVLALALAAIGLYAVISYTVARRTHEIGVRIALGAQTPNVLWLGVRQGLAVAAVGAAIGTGIALVVAGPLAPLLFDESPRDPLVYGIVAVVMLGVAMAASLIPAGRAAGVDPNVTLRGE